MIDFFADVEESGDKSDEETIKQSFTAAEMERAMGRYMRLGVIGALALMALAVVSVAAAASPREIYADYADNGRLDRTYSQSDLRNALNNAAVQGYGKPTVTPGLRAEIQGQLAESSGHGIGTVGRTGGSLPFTGVDLAFLSAGAGFLILLGWGLRRFARLRA